MANLLKKQLEIAQDFQDFIADCHRCKQQLQQTELAFLAPPAQRSQCRYFNAERLVNWAIDLLDCPVKSLGETHLIAEITARIRFESDKKVRCHLSLRKSECSCP